MIYLLIYLSCAGSTDDLSNFQLWSSKIKMNLTSGRGRHSATWWWKDRGPWVEDTFLELLVFQETSCAVVC